MTNPEHGAVRSALESLLSQLDRAPIRDSGRVTSIRLQRIKHRDIDDVVAKDKWVATCEVRVRLAGEAVQTGYGLT